MNQQELKYRIGITLIPGIGDVLAKKLIAYCGSPESVFRESKKNLLKIPDIGNKSANAICTQKVLGRAEQELDYINKNQITPLFYLDKRYPHRLKQCDDGPVMLYVKGNVDLNKTKVISVVGSRRATQYGKTICLKLVEGLKNHDILVVSGLAYGIDVESHKAALSNQLPTLGVIAHGLDMMYPSSHANIAEKMLNNGGLITEFLSGTNSEKENFPKRNRIIAGLADAVVVVESAKRGGGLITADIANSYNREVFAVPGNTGNPFSEGCNWLIKTNRAALAESANDIEYLMEWQTESEKTRKTTIAPPQNLSSPEKAMVNILSGGATGIDNICIQSNLPASQVASTLLNLEFAGIVKSLPGKVYQLN